MLPRRLAAKIKKIASLYPCVLISGPRQTGKTSLSKSLFPNHAWVLLDSNEVALRAREDPGLFLKNHPAPVIFDEIQKATDLLPEIKHLVDSSELPSGSIILTGSQPLELMKGVSESLAGRIGIIELAPMDIQEVSGRGEGALTLESVIESPPFQATFPLPYSPMETIFRGGFPAPALASLTPLDLVTQRFSDYVATYLTRDLRDLAQIQDLGRFERWLRVVASISSKIPNVSELSGQFGIPQTTAVDWNGLLIASLLLFEVPAFHSNLMKREARRSKLLLCDSGLMVYLQGYSTPAQLELSPLLGAFFETSVMNSLRVIMQEINAKGRLFYWRSHERDEVDAVIEMNIDTLIPVEIKFSTKVLKSEIGGIYKFMGAYKNAKIGFVITPGESFYWIDERILHVPWGAL